MILVFYAGAQLNVLVKLLPIKVKADTHVPRYHVPRSKKLHKDLPAWRMFKRQELLMQQDSDSSEFLELRM